MKNIKKKPHRTSPEILINRAYKKKTKQKPLFEETEGFGE